jgi:RimJ/RimL family protein N-acetyltransferase
METERLIIRETVIADLDAMLLYTSREDVMKFDRLPFNREELKDILEKYLEKKIFYSVILKESDIMIGHIVLGELSPSKNREFNLGYMFNPDFYNRGYCTEASKEIIQFAFNNLNARRIQASCNPSNVPSWKVLEKLGFKREGLLREKEAFRKDSNDCWVYTDKMIYGLLKSEWY